MHRWCDINQASDAVFIRYSDTEVVPSLQGERNIIIMKMPNKTIKFYQTIVRCFILDRLRLPFIGIEADFMTESEGSLLQLPGPMQMI